MTASSETRTGGSVYALLVGIDMYLPPVPALYGCKNDIGHLATYLGKRLGNRLRLMQLLDADASRQAVIDGFRTHLAQAGKGDVVVFAYSGHGSEEPAPEEFEGREATGKLQTLICADSCRRKGGVLVRPLADKELAVLISETAARGAHVAVILDCCHSGNGTRDAAVHVRQWLPDPSRARDADRVDLVALTTSRPVEEFIPGAATVARMPDHVALFACQPFQLAKETTVGWEPRGAFSVALLDALGAVGPATTYRSLLAAVRTRVERVAGEQEPVLFPTDASGPADTLVLDGAVQVGPVSFHLTKDARGWEVDAGAIHGIGPPVDGDSYEFTCREEGVPGTAGVVRVREVEAARCFVDPQGWEPRDIAYEAVVSSVPLPMAVVQVDPGDAAEIPVVGARFAAAVGTSGPGGGPSPFVRVADAGSAASSDVLALRVAVSPGGYEVCDAHGAVVRTVTDDCIRILRADGTPVSADVKGLDDAAVSRVVARVEHVARWEQIRALGGHVSALRDAVRLEVASAPAGVTSLPHDALWPPFDPAGGFTLQYARVGDEWQPPSMFIRVVNVSQRDLFVAVLDLTDRYRCHAGLFPTARVSAGVTCDLRDGRPIVGSLPDGRTVEPGATARDWLKVIVSETDFDATAFEMPALDEPFAVTRSARGSQTTLERLAARAITRDVGSADSSAALAGPDWCAQTYPVTITVP